MTPFFAPAPGFGGIARASAGLAREQARRGHAVTVVTARRDGAPAVAEEHGVRLIRLRVLGPRLLPFCPGIGRVLEDEVPRADVVHVHGHRHGLALAVPAACRRAGTRYLVQPHGTAPHHGQRRLAKAVLDSLGARRVIDAADGLLAVSDAEAAELPRPATVVGNGVDAPARPRPPRRPGPPRLLFVGNGSLQKRSHGLGSLLERLADAELTVAGPVGPDVLSGSPRVRRAGVLEDARLWDAYQDADVLVHPGVGEAFGLAVFEAAVLGTPPVAVGGHGAGEWLGRAGGTVVAPDDVDALARAVERLVGDPHGAAGEAATVARYVERRLRWPSVAPLVEEAYRQVQR